AAKESPADKRLVTDRPDFTEASSTVGRGLVQLESGYTYFRDKTGGVRTTLHSTPEALLRVGMFADWFEWRVGQNLFSERVTVESGDTITTNGAGDLYLGVKLWLGEQKSCLPELGLILQMTVPTGTGALSAGEGA